MKRPQPIIRAAGVVIWRGARCAPEFLLLRNIKGHWDFPKGRAEPGESSVETMRREVREEAGRITYAIDRVFDVRLRYVVRERNGSYRKTVRYFLGRWTGGRVRISREHSASRWTVLSHGLRLLVHPASRRLLRLASRCAAASGSFR